MKAVADLLNLFIASVYIAQLGIGWAPKPSSRFLFVSLIWPSISFIVSEWLTSGYEITRASKAPKERKVSTKVNVMQLTWLITVWLKHLDGRYVGFVPDVGFSTRFLPTSTARDPTRQSFLP
jgi:hypothetical protein